MRINTPQKICLAFLVFLVAFWVVLFIHGSKTGFYNYLYSLLFGLVPLTGGAVALTRVRIWGFRSAVGKAVFFIGLGIFCWGFASMIWSYYNFFVGIPAPYPSIADTIWAPSVFFYGLGAVYLAKATGARVALRNRYIKAFAFMASAVTLTLSYYVLVVVARGGVLLSPDRTPVKVILDIAYPFGDFISLVLSVVISGFAFLYLKSRYKLDIISILSGLAIMFVADAIFAYTTTTNTFYNGDVGDLILTIGVFLLTFGVLGFYTPHGNGGASPDMTIHGSNVVFTSAADDFALVVENEELADILKKRFMAFVYSAKRTCNKIFNSVFVFQV